MNTINELLAYWDSDEGRPFKGELIDMVAYEENPGSLSCLCAQGQALHILGGVEPKTLYGMDQENADKLTADLLKISRAHAVLLRNINDSVEGAPSIVLTDPGKVLGDQWSKLLDFWWALDQFTPAQWDAAGAAAWDAARAAAWAAAWAAARAAARAAAGAAAWDAARAAAWDAAGASSEIQGAALMRERGQAFYFLPFFGFADPEAIPARPETYGIA